MLSRLGAATQERWPGSGPGVAGALTLARVRHRLRSRRLDLASAAAFAAERMSEARATGRARSGGPRAERVADPPRIRLRQPKPPRAGDRPG